MSVSSRWLLVLFCASLAWPLVDRRLRLQDWERSVSHKLNALEAIYGKLRDAHRQRRSEVLEWIIITLIAVEIAFTLLGAR